MHSGNQEVDSEKVTDSYVTASKGPELLWKFLNIWEGSKKAEL